MWAWDWICNVVSGRSTTLSQTGSTQSRICAETREWADQTKLRWEERSTSHEQIMKGWGYKEGDAYIQYFCDQCGGELTPGPSGGGTNQVCNHCKINFGCLPLALER